MPQANTALSALAVLGVLSAGLRLVFACGIKLLVDLAYAQAPCSGLAVLNASSGLTPPHIIS